MTAMVLVVDDDEDVRETLRDAVSLFGRDVVVATDGAHAFEILRRMLRPCLILLDLVMPKLDGWRFLEQLRCDRTLGSIPVVVVSAHASSHVPTGADGLLPKPVDLVDLRRVVFEHCPG
jgi:CheY-like chemotaxis protein